MPRYVKVLLIVAWVAVLAACGGGGDGAEAPPGPGLLAGDPASRASAALADIEPVPAEAQDADGSALLTRINVVLRADASVADVNAAGQRVGATAITFSTRGSIVLTFAVPRQGSAAALAALAERLDGQPGIAFASPGREAEPLELPASGDVTASTSDLDHLLATRFPAAWNVRRAAASGCSGRKVTVIVPDFFFGTPANFVEQLEGSFSFDRLIPEPQAGQTPQPHGFRVAATLAAKFDALPSTGANPAPTCLQLRLVNGKGLTLFELVDRTAAAVRRESGPVIISSSIGYNLFICGPNGNDSCTAADIVPAAPSIRQNLRDHFMQGILWAAFAMQPGVVDRMLLVQAAGNDADTPLGRIYAGLRSARLGSPFAIATTLGELDVVATAPALWAPVAPAGVTLDPAVPDLSLDAATLAALRALRDLLVTNPVTNRNLLLIGASDNQPRLADLHAATLSNDGAALFAVGQGITTLDLGVVEGTSYSAPQVAGLASYLWLLEPSLASQPPAATIALLRATTQGNGLLGNVVDAYAAVLSLDEPAAVTPATARVRLAILDADRDGDGDFDLADLQAFHRAYVNAGAVLEPTAQDYGRFDLNGDGFTGGSRATRMDLDPTGSTRFGAPLLTQLQLSFGNAMLSIDETAVTDAQALCFYALSALYTGTDLEARDALLSDLCPTVAVVVERSNWVGQGTSSGGTTPLGAQLDFLSDGSLIGKAGVFSSTFDVSGQVAGNSLSFGVVSIREDSNTVITGTFTGSIDSARTQMSGGYSVGGESGSWTLTRCTGLDQPVVGCPG